jgi:hypothetical protein
MCFLCLTVEVWRWLGVNFWLPFCYAECDYPNKTVEIPSAVTGLNLARKMRGCLRNVPIAVRVIASVAYLLFKK